MQVNFLGLLVDMADAGETLTHLLTWRDNSGYGILNSLIKIWKKEEILYKVPRTESGCIAGMQTFSLIIQDNSDLEYLV